MTHLKDKVAVVTGAGRGIGRRAAIRLAGLGARVALVSRDTDQLSETAGEIARPAAKQSRSPPTSRYPPSVASLKAAVEEQVGPPSILINAAGVFGPIQLVWNTDPEDWIGTVMVNTVAPYLTLSRLR